MSAATMIPVPTDQLRSVATYVKETQPIVEKQGKLEATLSKRASNVVDALVRNGCLHAHLKEAKIREITDNPASLLDEVEKLAARVQVSPVGVPAQQHKEASADDSGNQGSANQVFLSTLTGSGQ